MCCGRQLSSDVSGLPNGPVQPRQGDAASVPSVAPTSAILAMEMNDAATVALPARPVDSTATRVEPEALQDGGFGERD